MGVRDLFFRIGADDATAGAFRGVARGLGGLEGAARGVQDRFARVARAVGGVTRAASLASSALGAGLGAGAVALSRDLAELERARVMANAGAVEFQRFAAAAKTVGFETDKTADVLKDVNDKVGDFLATGAGPMKDFFEQIAPRVGVTADAFRGLSGPQALGLYVRSLEAAGVNQQEMTFYLEALANDATLLAPLLANNAAELERLGDAAAANGLASADQLRAAREFQLALTGLSGAFRGLGLALIDAGVLESLTGFVQLVAGAIRDVTAAAPGLSRFAATFGLVGASVVPVVAAVGLFSAGVALVGAPVAAAIAGVAALTAGLVAFAPQIQAAYEWITRLGERIGAWFGAKLDAAAAAVKATADAIVEPFKRAYDVLVGNSIIPDLVDRALEEFGRLDADATASAESAAHNVTGVFEELTRGVAGLFEDMARSGDLSLKSLGRGLLDIGGQVAGGIAQQGARTLTTAALSSLGVPAFAHGGSFTVGGAGGVDNNLVAFMASRGERVTVTPQGQGGPQVVVNITTPDVEGFRRSEGQIAARLARAVEQGQGMR